jgi:hypothetical protein
MAWVAVLEGRADAEFRVQTLDSLVLDGPAASDAASYVHIALGRFYSQLGRPRDALNALRRRTYMTGWPRYLATARQEEAEVAALLGDASVVQNSQRRYLALRTSPEPGLAARVALGPWARRPGTVRMLPAAANGGR